MESKAMLLRVFDVRVGTPLGQDRHRVVAVNSMAAFQWALRHYARGGAPRSLVVKPAQI